MKTIYILFIILSVIQIHAQTGPPLRPFEKINFNGLDPIWYEACYHQSTANDFYDGYNQLKNIEGLDPVIFDDKVFTSFIQGGPNGKLYGGYLECRDLTTGALIWSHGYGHHTGQHQEVTRLMYT